MRGDLPAGLKARLTQILQNLDLKVLPKADLEVLAGDGKTFVPITDAAYDPIRDMVKLFPPN